MLKVRLQNFGDFAILHLEGGIVIGNTADLRSAVLSQSGVRVLILDLEQVNRIDASGLGVLLELREYLQSRAIDFKLMSVPTLIHQVLEITRLASVFEIITEDQLLSDPGTGEQTPYRVFMRAFTSTVNLYGTRKARR